MPDEVLLAVLAIQASGLAIVLRLLTADDEEEEEEEEREGEVVYHRLAATLAGTLLCAAVPPPSLATHQRTLEPPSSLSPSFHPDPTSSDPRPAHSPSPWCVACFLAHESASH